MRHLTSPSSSSSASSRFRRKSPIVLARYALIAGAISTILLLFWISSTTSGHDHSGDPSFFSRDRKDGNFQEDGKDREDHSSVISFLSRDRKDGNFQEDGQDREDEEVERERDGGEGEIRTEQQRSCATVEEMGKGFASGSEKENLRARELIKRHFEINELTSIVEHQIEASRSCIHRRIVHTRRNTINAKTQEQKKKICKSPRATSARVLSTRFCDRESIRSRIWE